MSTQLESFLLKTGLMTARDLEAAVAQAEESKTTLWEAVTRDERLSEDDLADTFARWFNLPRVRIASLTVEPEATHRVDDKLARRHACLPVKIEAKSLLLAVANPLDYHAIQDIEFHAGLTVRPLIATRTEILDGIDSHYASEAKMADFLANVKEADEVRIEADEGEDESEDTSAEAAEVAPVVKMCNLVLHDAIKMGASDVHVEPGLNAVQVRLRIDGVLRDYTQVPKWLHTPVVSRLKILAHLDIAERRVPQDGRINVQYEKKRVDIRVSTLPTHFGEKVVLRVLGSSSIPTLDVMGLSAPQAAAVSAALGQPQGMIIVTGPTGSGKSTTLYSMIERRKSPEVNIVTVEDPVEYQLAGISQVQVHPKAGLTFAAALRSILRQDPDVILVGEIRDPETAEIAFQAAVTGHLVLSTLHTNSSLATVARLLDIGVDPFLIASSVNLIIAQRLARRICPRCKEPYTPEAEVLERLKLDGQAVVFRRGTGCSMCGNTGFAGRTGIYEVLRFTPRLKELIHHRASEGEMRQAAIAAGTRFLLDEALRKVIMGHTTPEEVLRVIRLDESEQQILTCPSCLAPIEESFSTCPYCLHQLKRVCRRCGQELKLEWKACPYCHHKVHNGDGHAAPGGAHHLASPVGVRRPEVYQGPPIKPSGSGDFDDDDAPAPARGSGAQSPAMASSRQARGAPGNGRRPKVLVREPSSKRLRVLTVDDDAEMRKLVREALEQLPFEMDVVTASDGEEALLQVQAVVPDLVILDVVMPRVDGFEVCERLRDNVRTAFIPIMMLTASADETSRTTGFLVGTDDYVTKPFAVTEFNARVTRLLRRTYGI